MERVFIRDKIEQYNVEKIHKQKIGVISNCCGAGATFISTGIAFLLSRIDKTSVAYVEAGEYLKNDNSKTETYDYSKVLVADNTDIYDDYRRENSKYSFISNGLYSSLAMDKRFCLRGEFKDIFTDTEAGINIRNDINYDDGINWVLVLESNKREAFYGIDKTSKAVCQNKVITLMKIANNIRGQNIIIDYGAIQKGKLLNDILSEMDQVVYVIDPMPSKLIAGYESFIKVKQWEMQGNKVTYVVNKMNNAVNKRELVNYLKIKKTIEIDAIGVEHFYEAEYRCKIPLMDKKIYKEVGMSFEKLHKAIT